jgi:aspartyl-tRNA synthetase
VKDLPLQIEDAARPDTDFEKDPTLVRVGQDVRLDNRVLDLRTPANQAILRLQSATCMLYRECLLAEGFVEIHTPKLIATASESGASVFKLNYFDRHAYLAQSPQLYKQMALQTDLPRVFEIAPVFRAEQSFTHRHLTEFVGLDMEMHFNEHYNEVLDMLDKTFNHIFKGLNERFKDEIEAVRKQFPFEDLKFKYPCLKLKYWDAMKILREKGPAYIEKDLKAAKNDFEVKKFTAHIKSVKEHADDEDISTEDEKVLGRVIHDLYGEDFYMIDKFPSELRPFYTMEDPDDPKWSNSYDIFIRGEEVTSGAQRIHDSDMLVKRSKKLGVDLDPIQEYVDAFKYGAFPHAGGGIGLERVVMLFLQLNNIRKTSMFPRDPTRLTP